MSIYLSVKKNTIRIFLGKIYLTDVKLNLIQLDIFP